nr:reverse transcriptase domain-containing protein [Tanacetum cinerariifolium]
MFLEKYFPPSMVTKLRNEITNFRQRADGSLFEAWKRYKLSIDRCPNHNMLPVTQIDTFYNGLTLRNHDTINAAAGGTFIKRPLKAEMVEINKNLMKVLQINQQVKAVAHNYETCGGPHSYNDCPATVGQTQNLYAARAYNQGDDTASSSGSRTLPSNTITNPKEDLKGITTRSVNAYKGPMIPTTSSLLKVVEREIEVIKDTVPPTNNESTKYVQPMVVQIETPIPNSEPVVTLIDDPVVAPVSASKHNQKSSIPHPSRLHDQKLHDKTNDQKEKFFKIFQDLDFNISFADALILMPKFGLTIKSLLTNKLFELARTLLNEHCSAVLLIKLPEKLGDPGKFLISCDFPRMDECLALTDLSASLNHMSLSVWNNLSLLELSPTRSFLKTMRALIDVYEGELTLRVGNKAITFNLDQTSRYSANYDAMLVNQIDLIDVACKEYSQEVLGFSEKIHFMVKEGIVLGHKISKNRIEVDKAKVDVIAKLPHPTTVKGIRSFLGYAGFYQRLIQDFSKIARPMTRLLEKDTPFFFSKECVEAFQTLKKKLTEAPILVASIENPYQSVLDKKEINEMFPIKTLNVVSFRGDSSTPWDRKPLIFSRLATMDPSGDIVAQTTPPKSCLTLVFISPQSIEMPTTWSNLVTLVNVREKFRNVMKCLKIPSKFAKSLTFGASISWGHSRIHEGTSIYSCPSIIFRNGLKRKRSPPTTPELFVNSKNLSLLGLELPVLSLMITVRTSAMTNSQRSCLSTVSLTVLLPRITLKLVGKWKSSIVV